MATVIIDDLQPIDKAHWLLHLNACLKDSPKLRKDIQAFKDGGVLPNIKHPSYIHDWLERPEERSELEKISG